MEKENSESGPFCFSQSGTVWFSHMNRRAVTQQLADGTRITHIRPQGGKSNLNSSILLALRNDAQSGQA